MFDQQSRRQIIDIARKNGIDPATLLAVAWVESGGTPFWNIDGRMLPPIRFEGHYFHRILKGKDPAKLARAKAQGLAHPSPGAVRNPTNPQRYALLERAKAIDVDAAIESVSWGLGQVMGANWRDLGYSSARELESTARAGIGGQVDLMVRFIAANGLKSALNSQNWEKFARRYNGPSYAVGGYHTKMRKAYESLKGTLGDMDEAAGNAARAQPETDLRTIQLLLKNLGFDPGPVDGDWGPLTAAGVLAFQRHSGLSQTGLLDAATLGLLQTGSRPRIDTKRAVETESDLANKGSETIKLSRRGRLLGIVGMVAGALGFGQNQMLDSPPQIEDLMGRLGDNAILPLIAKLGLSTISGGGLWAALIGVGFMVYRNSKAVSNRRVEDHQQGWNIKF